MKNLIFIAAPASGKGTLSSILKERCGYSHVSTGDVLRNKIKEESDLGREVAEVIQSGKLVNDELMFKIIREELEGLDKSKPFILDGLPRTIDQAIYLETLFSELNIDNYQVIYLAINEDTALKRALGRQTCTKCGASYNKYFENFMSKKENICDKCGENLISRADDNEESFKIRFKSFIDNTLPIVDYYKNNDKLVKIESDKYTNEEIFDIIVDVVK